MTQPSSQLAVVTGGTGFTGSHLVRRLLRDGHHVRTLVRDAERARDIEAEGAELFTSDLRDADAMERLVEGADIVYHIAANFRAENVTYQEMFDINAQGTKNMLDAAIKANVQRFVHCSTVGVHGDVKNPPADENAPFNTGDYYQDSKLEGEKIAQQYIQEERLPITIYRPAGIYGPGDMRFLKLVKGINNGTFVMIGSGETLFHLVYIDDLIDGILLCGQEDAALGEVYILAGPDYMTLNELVQLIAVQLDKRVSSLRVPFQPVYAAGYLCELIFKPLGINPPLHRRRVDFFRKNRCFDISKAQQQLHYAPQIDTKEGFKRLIEWYRAQNLL